jgi:hypothetical protein
VQKVTNITQPDAVTRQDEMLHVATRIELGRDGCDTIAAEVEAADGGMAQARWDGPQGVVREVERGQVRKGDAQMLRDVSDLVIR